MHDFAWELFPICRSLTGEGVRQTLARIKKELPDLRLVEVPSGTKCFDWEVPREWNIQDAWIIDPDGNKIVDFKKNNLHVVGYSIPVVGEFTLEELQPHLFSLSDQPTAIPYITSYYREFWGFCMTDILRKSLKPGKYKTKIESRLTQGHLTYGELLIPGRSKKEIFLSTYVCHPSMANNELSGPAVTTWLAKWILKNTDRRFSYRIVFIPETIGSIVYLSRHAEELKSKMLAGYVISCVGDERTYSYLPSRHGNTLTDRVSIRALKEHAPDFIRYSFLDRGSDERQYCSPGIDLPVALITRSKFGAYPEYHTSLDDLNFVTAAGLQGAFEIYTKCIKALEASERFQATILCEAQLGKRGLYPTIGTKNSALATRVVSNLLAFSDGNYDLQDIAEKLGMTTSELRPTVARLLEEKLLKEVD
jgi:aminopeptidase-like protein